MASQTPVLLMGTGVLLRGSPKAQHDAKELVHPATLFEEGPKKGLHSTVKTSKQSGGDTQCCPRASHSFFHTLFLGNRSRLGRPIRHIWRFPGIIAPPPGGNFRYPSNLFV